MSYEEILKNRKQYTNVIYEYIILDEGHKIKNHNTILSRCICELHGKHKIIVSGTPIQVKVI